MVITKTPVAVAVAIVSRFVQRNIKRFTRSFFHLQASAMNLRDAANWPLSRFTTKPPTRLVRGFHSASLIIHMNASRSVNGSGLNAG